MEIVVRVEQVGNIVGSVAGCFLDGSRVASGWAGGVAGGQKWVARVVGWESSSVWVVGVG